MNQSNTELLPCPRCGDPLRNEPHICDERTGRTVPAPEAAEQPAEVSRGGVEGLNLVITCNEAGQCVCVSRQDPEGRIHEVIWEAEQPAGEGMTDGELHPELAKATANTALQFLAQFNPKNDGDKRIDWFSDAPWPDRMDLAKALDHLQDLAAMTLNLADRVGTKPVDFDEAHVALLNAIEAITLGNKTDDKLILKNLRKAGYWLCHLTSKREQAAGYVLDAKYEEAIAELAAEKDLSPLQVIKQALKLYQMHEKKFYAGCSPGPVPGYQQPAPQPDAGDHSEDKLDMVPDHVADNLNMVPSVAEKGTERGVR